MANIYEIYPDNPQPRIISNITKELKNGAIMLYPTDTVYAIGCDLNVKSAVQKVRALKQIANDKPLTFLCSSLSNISEYAIVTDQSYKIMKRLIPGPYTFILQATKLVPKLVINPKRKTTGIRVPDHNVCKVLLESLGNPVISTSAHVPEDENGQKETEFLDKFQLFDRLDKLVDIIIDDYSDLTYQVSTIIDVTNDQVEITRKGLGFEQV